MKFWDGALLACGGLVLLGSPLGEPIAVGQQSVEKQLQEQQRVVFVQVTPGQGLVPVERAALSELPESPGAVRLKEKAEETPQLQSSSSPAPSQSSPSQSSSSQASQPPRPQASPEAQPPTTQPPAIPQQPVGTAAAETSKVTGVAASQPAGVAIAPAKQRRVRSLVIKVGAIVGASIAVGTVVALSEATASKPPGAH